MAQLYFYYGTMGSGKSLDLIRTAYNYKERGMNPIILKSKIDTRENTEECIISSRTGSNCKAEWIYNNTNIYNYIIDKLRYYESIKDTVKINIDVIIIDEIQFLNKEQILQLSDIVTELNIPVICYGLKNDFKGNLFPAIETLLVYADKLIEIKSICWCGRKANHNARIINNKIIKDGEQIQIGGNESYIALCNKHFKEGKINGN